MNDEMQVTVIAAGFDEIEEPPAEEYLAITNTKRSAPAESSYTPVETQTPVQPAKQAPRRALEDDYEVPPFLRKTRK